MKNKQCSFVSAVKLSAFLLPGLLSAGTVYEPVGFTSVFLHFTGAGTAQVLKQGGPDKERCCKISTTKVNKHRWEATRYKIFGRRNYQLWGEKIEYSFAVKGKGTLQLICMNRGDRDSAYAPYEMQTLQTVKLSDKWQNVKAVFPCLSPRFGRNAHMTYKITGEGNYFIIAKEKLSAISPAAGAIKAQPRHLITYPGEKTKVTFTIPGKRKLTVFDGTKQFDRQVSGKLQVDVSGKIPVGKPAPGTRIPGVGRVSVYDPATGENAAVFVNCIPKAEYAKLDDTAQKIRLKKPLNVLFLGDSLTDYDRDRNYVDKVSFWVNKYNPGKWRFRNAGVGGDHIVSLHNRLTGSPRTWRRNMYKDLFKTQWDMIFIFLGHNDTRAHYRTDGNIYQPVPPENQRIYWRKTLEFLRQKSKAKIVLISPSASDFAMCLKAASCNKKAGRNYVIFGEAARVKEYCAIQKKIAQEFKLDIIDIYTPLEKMSKKSHLFTKPDGVHLSSSGNNFVSCAILKYLAQ